MQTATLNINLTTLSQNWQVLQKQCPTAQCAAVVKANAYSLGAVPIVKQLYAMGCRQFFVAHLSEAVEIKPFALQADIYILNGITPDEVNTCIQHNFIPVVSSPENLQELAKALTSTNTPLRIALHIDTGINRLGLQIEDIPSALQLLQKTPQLKLEMVMSHLACADEQNHPLNEEQLSRFREVLKMFPASIKSSLANSSGLFLGENYHFNLTRPGYALYGGNPTPWQQNPMQEVISITAPLLQTKTIPANSPVGYGATYSTTTEQVIGITPFGYADGFNRLHSNTTHALIENYKVPVIGRVSMDLVTLDLSNVPASVYQSTPITFLGGELTLEKLAQNTQTIGYEVLTSLGNRLQRNYIQTI